ncbi:MAG: hypothetical protein KC464_00405 [Myxococcales bacterium]|nr:hypothetical protein [Myxococcales bacterium]
MIPRQTIRVAEGVLVVDGAGDALDLWTALRQFFLERRRPAHATSGVRYPETSNVEVLGVCALFDRELARAPRGAAGFAREAVRWRQTTRRVRRLTQDAEPAAPYPQNASFWLHDTKRLALYLAVARDLPSQAQVIDELIADGQVSS